MSKIDSFSVSFVQDIIDQDGILATLNILVQALKEYADDMIDLSLKERAIKSANAAEKLAALSASIEDF